MDLLICPKDLAMDILVARNHDSGKMETGLPLDGNQLNSA